MTEPHPPEPTPHYVPPGRSERPPVRKRLGRRIGRAVAIGIAAALGLVLLAIVGALVWLHTGGGAQTLGRLVTREGANAIQGKLRVASIEVRGFLSICADGVDLGDPDGHAVLRAERVCLHVDPLALRLHKVLLSDVRIVRPWIETVTIEGPDGKPTTTAARAIAPRTPPSPSQQSSPFAWVVDVTGVRIEQGSFAMRPSPGAPPTFALEGLDLADGRAHYAADASAARLQLAAQLAAPGRAPVAVTLDARLDGNTDSGKATLNELRARFGQSGLAATGSYDLAARTGEVKVRDLRVVPADLDLVWRDGPGPLAGEVRGEMDLRVAGRSVDASARLQAGGGTIASEGQVALDDGPRWSGSLQLDRVDPGKVARAAPSGMVTARIEARGSGTPRLDAQGIRGDLQAKGHVGPAHLERIGEVKADLDATLRGRNALVRAFTATAFGITASAHGEAARDALALDVDLRAQDLSAVGKAIGALQKGPTVPLSGSAHLSAHVTGSWRRPDAQVHFRAPLLRSSGVMDARKLAVDGRLQGSVNAPNGQLTLTATDLWLGQIRLRAPRIVGELAWPWAHLRIGSTMDEGQVQLAGDARIDDDKDGLLLSNFVVSYPGNELHLAHDVRVHLRQDQTVVEPLDLVGDHGSLRLSAQLGPSRLDAAVVVTRFDLSRLPQFPFPPDFGLRGVLDGNLVVSGPRSRPDLDLQADLRGGAIARTADLPLDAHARVHLHAGRLRASGTASAPRGPELTFDADAPVRWSRNEPPTAPLSADIALRKADLAVLADRLHLEAARAARVSGTVDLRLLASGTLAAPNATLSVEARGLGTTKIHGVDMRAGVVIDKARAALDGTILLGGEPTVSLAAQTPFELLRALRESSYLAGALDRPVQADVAISSLPLERLARAGALPPDSKGDVGLTLHLAGTVSAPKLSLSARGDSIISGQLKGVSFQSQLSLDQNVAFNATAQTNGAPVVQATAAVPISGRELVDLVRRRAAPAALDPFLDRPVSLAIDVPGLVIGRVTEVTGGGSIASEGQLTGRVRLTGSAADPRLELRVEVRDVGAKERRLGDADVSVDATSSGAVARLGINPPGGGSFIANAKLAGNLGARALIRQGTKSVLDGQLTGDVSAKRLDVAFVSGVIPTVRRTEGILDADVKVSGVLRRPVAQGEAHLVNGLLDIVGQGVFDNLGLDATFSPKEVVIDRLSGSTNGGTFAAILVGSRKPSPAKGADRIEFTGEIHLGDDESVKRKNQGGATLKKGAVPIRYAGEERVRVTGEIDFFGDYTGGELNFNAKVPSADAHVLKLPDKQLPSLDPHPDVLLVHPGEKPHPPGKEPEEVAAEEKARQQANLRLHAKFDVDHFYVTADDFEFPIESHLTIEYDAKHPDRPSIDGTLHVPRGSFSALGRRFTIEDAKITLTGGDPSDPELDIKARYNNPNAVVTIVITGTAKKPVIDLTSTPPMDQDAIAFLLATGRIQGQASQTGGSVDMQGAATSLAGSLLFGQVRNVLKDVLPVDVLTVETQGGAVSEASVGKYIGDRVYLGYRQRLVPPLTTAENNVEGHIEYELGKRLAAEATIGDKAQEVSIIWTHDF